MLAVHLHLVGSIALHARSRVMLRVGVSHLRGVLTKSCCARVPPVTHAKLPTYINRPRTSDDGDESMARHRYDAACDAGL